MFESVKSGGKGLEEEIVIESPFSDNSAWPIDYERWKQEQALPFELRTTDEDFLSTDDEMY